jgi:galactokinase
MKPLAVKIKNKFKNLFGTEPLVIRSPGRINLIGEHTDYNDGFVLPAAINREIIMAITKRRDDLCHIFAYDMQQNYVGKLHNVRRSPKGWPNYLLGVVEQLIQRGKKLSGFNCVFGGDIPIGSGLSSSAALEGAIGFALNKLYDFNLDKIELVRIGQDAEHQFVGVNCGIMDQFINVLAKATMVFRIDCRSLNYSVLPFPVDKVAVVLCDTHVHRALASSQYNLRRRQCEQGVRYLQKADRQIRNLRDVSLNLLDENRRGLPPVIYKRCAYVISENFRVLNGCRDLEKGDVKSFGQRMYESHAGLRDEYEVSCRELDILVDLASRLPGAMGARMMGAGFGGCTINLVQKRKTDSFIKNIAEQYMRRTGKMISTYTCDIVRGVSVLSFPHTS